MPLKTFTGFNVSVLMQQAQRAIGADAVVLHVRRIRTADGPSFQLTASDPETAAREVFAAPAKGYDPALETIRPRLAEGRPFVLALVGPTGAGKTTTLAKLATSPRVFGGLEVGLVSLDTYRIGALEQLGTYADIAKIRMVAVYDQDDADRALASLAGCQVILVDTPGRSPKARADLDATQSLLSALRPDETHVVVPASGHPELARRAVVEARRAGATHLLVTKTDEAPDYAGLFDLAASLKVPVRWLTDGQEVPFDLVSAAEPMAAARFGAASGEMAEVR